MLKSLLFLVANWVAILQIGKILPAHVGLLFFKFQSLRHLLFFIETLKNRGFFLLLSKYFHTHYLFNMANRAYLYSANETMTKLRDVSESRYPIPLFYKIILGEDTSMCDSKIWGYEHPIAIKGDFQKGLNKLYTFYDYLATQSAINSTEIAKYKAETKAFFEKEQGRINQYFFLRSRGNL